MAHFHNATKVIIGNIYKLDKNIYTRDLFIKCKNGYIEMFIYSDKKENLEIITQKIKKDYEKKVTE